MDIILLLLLTYGFNLSYNNFIFILPFLFFNNQATNISKNTLYNSRYNNYNFSSNNMNTENNYTPSYDVAITNCGIDSQGTTPEEAELEYMDLTSTSSINSSEDATITAVSETTPHKNNAKTTSASKATPLSKNNSTHRKTVHTQKITSNSKTKADSSSVLSKNHKGSCTIISTDGTFTGKIIEDLNNVIALRLENNHIIYINKNSILSFY